MTMTSSRPHRGELAQFPSDGRRSLRPPDGNQRSAVGRGAGKETEGGEGAIGDEQSVPGDDEATHVLVEVRVHVGPGRVSALLPPDVHGATWYRDVVGALSTNTVGPKLDFRKGFESVIPMLLVERRDRKGGEGKGGQTKDVETNWRR